MPQQPTPPFPRLAMRAAGVNCLSVLGSTTPPLPQLNHLLKAEAIAKVAKTFPDQQGWILFLAKHVAANNIATFMTRLSYSREPELLSARLCLYCGRGGSASRVLPSREKLVHRLRTYVSAHGIPPSPPVLLGGPGWEVD